MTDQVRTALHPESTRQIGIDRWPTIHTRPAWRRLATTAFAGLYLGGAVYNAFVTVPEAREVFESFADMAWLGPYRWLIDNLFLAAPTACAATLAAFELAVGVGIVAGGQARRAALVAATAFVIALIPSLSWPYWTANVGLAALQVRALRRIAL